MSEFVVKDAERVAQSVSVGLFGPSGCGKTLSALRIAKGIQSVVGGNIYVIDTEARRALDYSDDFAFKHLDFAPPFGSDRYLDAVEKCRAHGAPGTRTIVIDSLSHEHESEGGMLEQFEAELARLGGGEKNNARAWIKPKAKRRKLIVRMEQMRDVNFILTFRAVDKTKPGKDSEGKSTYVHMGFVPIGGSEFVFGTKATAFLPPGSDGIPLWNPEFVGEKMMRKLPSYLKPILADGKPLSEEHGRRIAEWAKGGAKVNPQPSIQTLAERVDVAVGRIASKATVDKVRQAYEACATLIADLETAQEGILIDRLIAAKDERLRELTK